MQAIKNTSAEYRNQDTEVKHFRADFSARLPMNRLGEALRSIRRRHHTGSMADFAEQMELSERALSNYELGKRLPDIDTLIRFAAQTDSDLSELLAMRIEAAGHEIQASQLRDARAEYMTESSASHSGFMQNSSAHARRALISAQGLDPAWSLALMELAARGEISAAGVDRLIEIFQAWQPDQEWLIEQLEALGCRVQCPGDEYS